MNYKIYRSDRRSSLESHTKKAMDEKTVNVNDAGPVTMEDLPYINAAVSKGETVEIRPGPDNTAKIMGVKRKFLKPDRK